MSLIAACIKCGEEIEIQCSGPDEGAALKKALELGIACTGADDNGAYNIYFNDSALRTTPKLVKCLSSFTSR